MKLPFKRPIKIKGHLRDLMALRELLPNRRQRFVAASRLPVSEEPIRELVGGLHPARQHLALKEIRDETAATRSFELVPDPDSSTRQLAYFRAGQYLSLKLDVDGYGITRPYSISSAPVDALAGIYEITIKRRVGGFATDYLWSHWRPGTRVEASGPAGSFYVDPLRDQQWIVALAGGCGITPFRSMAREIVHGQLDRRLTILYGNVAADDIIFKEELDALAAAAPDRLRVVHVLSGGNAGANGCETGFLNADLIRRTIGAEGLSACSFFICGPQIMSEFVQSELAVLRVSRRRIRREVYGEPVDVTKLPRFPAEKVRQTSKLRVHHGQAVSSIPGAANESVLVALERAKLAPNAECRSGECGCCRTRLLAGDLFISPENDGRRAIDRRTGFFHACAAYPLGDIEIEIHA